MEREQLFERLQKLLALAKGGVGGEAATAKQMLDKLMAANGITMDQLDKEELIVRKYSIKTRADSTILLQTCCKVLNVNRLGYRKRGNWWYIEATALQHLEIAQHYSVYREALAKEIKKLITAFVQANNIFSSVVEPDKDRKLSNEELREIWEILQMASTIKPTEVRKALT